MKTTRRDFLTRSALGVGSALLVAPLLAETKPRVKNFDPFERVTLGKSKVKFTRLTLGTGMKGGKRESNHTRMGKDKFEALIREAHDRGVRTYDLADLYGTHPYVIPALKGISRDKFQIVSKIWFKSGGIPEAERPDADVVIERFLRELKTDHIELVLLHCVTSAKWPEELRKQMDLLSKLKDKGMIGALGVSCHSLEALERCVDEPWVESVHTRINPYGMSMDGPPEKVVPVLKRIHDAGKGVVGMKIVGEGRLRNDEEKRAESVKFALNLGCVDILNVGCENISEVDDLAAKVRLVEHSVG
jgi:aryl-alcohol dehydrogenase-like predicted oxidoreductase